MPRLARTLAATLAIAGIQSAALGWIIMERNSVLKHGREIVLPVTPVDPRSLFRGDYVILNYDITTLPGEIVEPSARRKNAPIYVTLEQKDGKWTAVAASSAQPTRIAADQVVLQGRVRSSTGARHRILVRYGIQSYFVPEGTGRTLERRAQKGELAMVIAVDADGKAAIKGILLDGSIRYEEPLL